MTPTIVKNSDGAFYCHLVTSSDLDGKNAVHLELIFGTNNRYVVHVRDDRRQSAWTVEVACPSNELEVVSLSIVNPTDAIMLMGHIFQHQDYIKTVIAAIEAKIQSEWISVIAEFSNHEQALQYAHHRGVQGAVSENFVTWKMADGRDVAMFVPWLIDCVMSAKEDRIINYFQVRA